MSLQSCSLSSSKGCGMWGMFPVSGKRQTSHVFRKSKKEDPDNYRLVGITTVPVEAVKQILLEALSQRTKEKKVIWSSQCGLAKGKSCLMDLIAL